MRRQRLSPLFPYTTLFRSPVIGARVILTKGYTDEQLHAMTADTKRMALASEASSVRSEEHTSELQSRQYLVCRLLLEKKKPGSCQDRSDPRESGGDHNPRG